tara:strand:+ start:1104 stop:1940 length:837 start_codon:yes stop_codon:yes gene_type:complete
MPTHPLKLRNRSLLRSNGYNRILSAFPIWKGKSLIDGTNIMVCLSNITTKCSNEKIAFNSKDKQDDVLQVWYLREDEAPQKVFNSKQKSVCGDCQHLKDRSCYVVWFQAPLAVWKAAKDKPVLPATLVKQLTKDMFIRLGAAGDPASAPAWVSRMVSENARAVAGYTHQWHKVAPDSSLKHFVMASVDSPYQARLAQEMGWRTFRTEPENGRNWDAFDKEIECLAELKGLSCDRCGLCNGNRRNGKGKNIKIRVHGVHSGKYKQDDNKFYSIRRENHK